MKILVLRFPLESAQGGAEWQTCTLMEELTRRGHTVLFVGSCPVLLAACRKAGLPCEEWHIGPPPVTRWGAISFLWRQVAMRRSLRALLHKYGDVDAFIFLSLSEKLLLTRQAAQQGKRILWVEHDRIGRWLSLNPWLPVLRRMATYAITVTVGRSSIDRYVQLGWQADRIVAIPNGVRVANVRSADAASPSFALSIVCIARLSPEKGIDLLLQACAQMKVPWKLRVVGEGSMLSSLQQMADHLHIAPHVEWMGRVAQLESVYALADVLVLPSRDHEPFGLVVAEAMMRGIATVVTDACGVADDLVHGRDALVVPAGDATALADALVALQDAPTRHRVGSAGHDAAMRLFDVERMVDAYEALLGDSKK